MDNINLAELGESAIDMPSKEPVRNSTTTCSASDDKIDGGGNLPKSTEPKIGLSTALGLMSAVSRRLVTIIDLIFAPSKTPSVKPEAIDEKLPPGWPSIAHSSASGHNTSMFPKFDTLTERVLIDQQTKLWALGQALADEDKQDEKDDNGRLYKLEFNADNLLQRRPAGGMGSCGNSVTDEQTNTDRKDCIKQTNTDRKDCIKEELFMRIIRYRTLLWLQHEMDTFISISPDSYETRRERLKSEFPPGDSDALRALLHEPDDFITTRSKQVHVSFERFLHSKRFPFLKDWFVSIFGDKAKSRADPKNDFLDTDALILFTMTVMSLLFGIVQIAPIAILLLADLSKAESLGVVIIFSVLFVMVMNMLGAKSDGLLVGFSAYLAVMVVFLGNLQQGS